MVVLIVSLRGFMLTLTLRVFLFYWLPSGVVMVVVLVAALDFVVLYLFFMVVFTATSECLRTSLRVVYVLLFCVLLIVLLDFC